MKTEETKKELTIYRIEQKSYDYENFVIEAYYVFFGNEDTGPCTRYLWNMSQIANIIGYSENSWKWKAEAPKIKIRRFDYTDSSTLIYGLTNKVKLRSIKVNPHYPNILKMLNSFKEKEHGSCDIWTLINALQPPKVQSNIKRDNVSNNNLDLKVEKEANGNQVGDLLEAVHPCNDMADAFNNVFDSAKEITRYGELMHKGIQLTNEMSAMRVQIADLMQKLKVKEVEFNSNQKEITEMKQSLVNNPLLRLTEATNQEDNSDELKRKLERLEAENQVLKEEKKSLEDRIGEGENFKTAAMFPNKEEYFIGDTKEVNCRIGLAATNLASDNRIDLPPKIRNGAEDVRIYPTHLLQSIEEDLKTHTRNKYTVLLNPVLKAEYVV